MLLQSNMVKRLIGVSGGDLEAKTGESLRVKRIECIPSGTDDYLTITVDLTTVAYYRVKTKSGNHLSTILSAYLKQNLMEFLTSVGINVTIPIAEGQTLSVCRAADAGNVMLIYDRYTAGDVKASDPNGSESNIYTFLQYAKVGTVPVASGDALIDTALTPSMFPDFPCAKVVPARHTIDLLGIFGSPFVDAVTATNCFHTTFLKLIRDREVLFDQDRNGIPFDGEDQSADAIVYASNFSLIGPGTEILLNTNAITNGKPLMFDPPLKFEAGQELNAFLSIVKTGTHDYTDNADDQGFILRVTRR